MQCNLLVGGRGSQFKDHDAAVTRYSRAPAGVAGARPSRPISVELRHNTSIIVASTVVKFPLCLAVIRPPASLCKACDAAYCYTCSVVYALCAVLDFKPFTPDAAAVASRRLRSRQAMSTPSTPLPLHSHFPFLLPLRSSPLNPARGSDGTL